MLEEYGQIKVTIARIAASAGGAEVGDRAVMGTMVAAIIAVQRSVGGRESAC